MVVVVVGGTVAVVVVVVELGPVPVPDRGGTVVAGDTGDDGEPSPLSAPGSGLAGPTVAGGDGAFVPGESASRVALEGPDWVTTGREGATT